MTAFYGPHNIGRALSITTSRCPDRRASPSRPSHSPRIGCESPTTTCRPAPSARNTTMPNAISPAWTHRHLSRPVGCIACPKGPLLLEHKHDALNARAAASSAHSPCPQDHPLRCGCGRRFQDPRDTHNDQRTSHGCDSSREHKKKTFLESTPGDGATGSCPLSGNQGPSGGGDMPCRPVGRHQTPSAHERSQTLPGWMSRPVLGCPITARQTWPFEPSHLIGGCSLHVHVLLRVVLYSVPVSGLLPCMCISKLFH